MKKLAKTDIFNLLSCNWEITLKCTLNCVHCGSHAGKARQNELGLDECFSVADQLIALECKHLTMIGGEVFLVKGWEKLAHYLSENDLSVNIVTNGYRLGKPEIEQIKYARLVNVGISVDGMEVNHNRVRGRDDAFLRVQNTLDLLAQEDISVGVVSTLMNFNVSDLEEMFVFLNDHHVQIWQLQLASPMGKLTGKDDITVDPGKIKNIIQFIREKTMERQMVVVAADSIGYYDDNETFIRGIASPINCFQGCSAGISSLFIDSIGNVKGCGALYSDVFIEGNLRQKSLAEIWKDPNTFSYNRQFSVDKLTGRCLGCEVGDQCKGGCRSSNHFSTGSLFSNAYCVRNQ